MCILKLGLIEAMPSEVPSKDATLALPLGIRKNGSYTQNHPKNMQIHDTQRQKKEITASCDGAHAFKLSTQEAKEGRSL